MAASYGSVPFQEQIEFMRRKLAIPTAAWTDIYNAEHDWSFMVAGANRNAIVQDFHAAVTRFLEEGRTLEQFRQDFDRIVATHGWDYNGGRLWRSRTIYETNLYSSYNAGRYQQLYASRDYLPYWQYHHSDAVEHPREEHLAWDGMILRWDNEWWQWFFPINAWGCQCSVTALSEADLERLGKSGPDTAPEIEWEERLIGQRGLDGPRTVRVPKGIDPGFEHIPGASRLHSAVPPELPDPPPGSSGAPGVPNTAPSDPLPPPRAVGATELLPQDLSDEEYSRRFLERFDATLDEPVIYRDVIGEPLVIGAEMFTQRRTGESKANKGGRGQYLPLLANAIIDPDEIWVRAEYHQARKRSMLRRRYIARWLLPDQEVPALAVFELGESGWSGVTVFQTADDAYLEAQRIGVRLYRREE
jgi:hypothetical protein